MDGRGPASLGWSPLMGGPPPMVDARAESPVSDAHMGKTRGILQDVIEHLCAFSGGPACLRLGFSGARPLWPPSVRGGLCFPAWGPLRARPGPLARPAPCGLRPWRASAVAPPPLRFAPGPVPSSCRAGWGGGLALRALCWGGLRVCGVGRGLLQEAPAGGPNYIRGRAPAASGARSSIQAADFGLPHGGAREPRKPGKKRKGPANCRALR